MFGPPLAGSTSSTVTVYCRIPAAVVSAGTAPVRALPPVVGAYTPGEPTTSPKMVPAQRVTVVPTAAGARSTFMTRDRSGAKTGSTRLRLGSNVLIAVVG